MPRRGLHESAGVVFHVLNRGVRRMTVFEDATAYQAFMHALQEGQERSSMRLLAYCVMPNHFHLVLWPFRDGQLIEFMRWFQMVHSKRWHQFRQTEGSGALYQGRYKAFPVQNDHHFLTVCRYVERNPLRAGLVRRAQDWPWSSLGQRCRNCEDPSLHPWPIPPPSNWVTFVNSGEIHAELDAVRHALTHGVAFGSPVWAEAMRARGLAAQPQEGRPLKGRRPRGDAGPTQPGLRFA
ncbi:MAG TPA: transposase [Vicinamibacterales bacterium]|nr:transposase [Vicinamibacterales bacterium]